MNGNNMKQNKWEWSFLPNKRTLLLLSLLSLITLDAGAEATTFGEIVRDPLMTRPPVLDLGVVLPSDTTSAPCPVQKDFNQPLALSEAVDLALCNNAQIKMAWANIKIQAGALGEANAAYLPTLSGTISRLKNRTGFPDQDVPAQKNMGDTAYGSFNWEIFDFGGRSANRASANLLLQSALSNHDATIQKTLTALIQAYFDALTAKETLAIRDNTLRIAQQTLDSARKREARGAIGRSDTLQAAAALAKATLTRSRADGDLHKALAVLVYTMGIQVDTTIVMPEMATTESGNEIKELQAWLSEAETSHPAIVAARAEWAAAKEKITVVRSEGLPRLDFAANYYKNGYPNQGLQSTNTNTSTVGITLTIPIFDGFAQRYKVSGAQAQAEQKEQQLRDTEHQILMDVVKTYSDAMSSLNNLQSSEALVTAAQDSLTSSKRRYDKGAADITELLNTQATYDDAEQERVRCVSEWRSARLILLTATGEIGRRFILEGR